MSGGQEDETRVVLFDGVCNLCCRGVHFIVRRDPARRFRFAPLQSPAARRILEELGQEQAEGGSIVLVVDASFHMQSDAALRIAAGLRWPWPALCVLALVPRFIRDRVYMAVANNRYRWFGRRPECFIPAPEIEDLFLESNRS